MNIQDNKKMWFHRRIMAYISILLMLISFVAIYKVTMLIFYSIATERLIGLQYVFLGVYIFFGIVFCVCGLILLCYYHYTTQHDKAFLPSLIEAIKN